MKRLAIITLLFLCVACEKRDIPPIVLLQEDSQLQIRNGILYHENRMFTGVLKSFDAVNQTNNTATYLNGKKAGEEIKLFINSELAEVRFYRKGIKVGTHKAWSSSGQQKFEYPYNDEGVYHGTIKEWYPNGQLVKEFHYVHGKEIGTQKMWTSNGKLMANYTVIQGERFGLIGLKKCYSVNTKDEN